LITREILSAKLAGNNEDDAPAGIRMLKGESAKIKGFKGDGAYDKFGFREVLGHDVEQVIPPSKNAAGLFVQKEKTVTGTSDSAQ
jgi:hypothetical protein